MTKVNVRGEPVRRFIVQEVEAHPSNIARLTAERFGITRQAANKHLQRLVAEGVLETAGQTRSRTYQLAALQRWEKGYLLAAPTAEDRAWREDVKPALGVLPDNVMDIWHYGFTEMFNNAVDHSDGRVLRVQFERTAASTEMSLFDDGIGIFRKIKEASGLVDERHSVLELAKGKFTTDPRNHSGEGIFFTSRMFDEFSILSGEIFYSHRHGKDGDWILESQAQRASGTLVSLKLSNHSSRTLRQVFDSFSVDDDYGFSKTIVPMELAQFGDENLVSRSQAKRLLTRIEKFKVVILDFAGIESIGQAFADEVFRVFAARNPAVELVAVNAAPQVERMVSRARSHDAAGTS